MAKSIKLTRIYKSGNDIKETTIYIMVDNILYIEECDTVNSTKGSTIFFNSVVGQSYAPMVVEESPEVIANLINTN